MTARGIGRLSNFCGTAGQERLGLEAQRESVAMNWKNTMTEFKGSRPYYNLFPSGPLAMLYMKMKVTPTMLLRGASITSNPAS